ncbi:MmcQ/YjbR family DNA-binding protein [Shewanella maritima]|uniref:MmcQ/YjbR family DNA-binding protein n=1 Tax=Shewanella maritima TaxID=2520507 RepID=A0A411PKJ2_9GAMM|nr:MmcQ/YjbR family DNA-binding protein [Shewanella maritima]QBF84039.1 MmcQ/YjbR family DNA-binding protein [Shewanella maritima]
MQFETLRNYLLAKPEATESFPFGEGAHVFKVKGKMFALIAWRDGVLMMNLKCDPDEAIALCDIFDAIKPGYHMDNTICYNYPYNKKQRVIPCNSLIVM